MLANNPGIQGLISQIFEPGDIWAFLQSNTLNKAALTVAGLLAIDFFSCKWNVIYSCEKSDFGDVLKIILDLYRFCTYVGTYIPFFLINRWKYLDLAVVNIYALLKCAVLLVCALKSWTYMFPFILLMYSEIMPSSWLRVDWDLTS